MWVCGCVCPGGPTVNNIRAEGARALGEALKHNSTLNKLYLGGEPHRAPPYPMMWNYCSLGSCSLSQLPDLL